MRTEFISEIGGENVTTIAMNIKRLRAEKGMTQMSLARAADLPLGTIARIEAGNSMPRVDTAEKLASGLGVPLGDLLKESQVNRA
jgi:transcriptional regulator with XRE-family HTH domain